MSMACTKVEATELRRPSSRCLKHAKLLAESQSMHFNIFCAFEFLVLNYLTLSSLFCVFNLKSN